MLSSRRAFPFKGMTLWVRPLPKVVSPNNCARELSRREAAMSSAVLAVPPFTRTICNPDSLSASPDRALPLPYDDCTSTSVMVQSGVSLRILQGVKPSLFNAVECLESVVSEEFDSWRTDQGLCCCLTCCGIFHILGSTPAILHIAESSAGRQEKLANL